MVSDTHAQKEIHDTFCPEISICLPIERSNAAALKPFPPKVFIDGIGIDAFQTRTDFFERLVIEARKPGQSVLYYLNVHLANMVQKYPRMRHLLNSGNLIYCDGAGILLASRILGGEQIPRRFASGDWLFEMWDYLGAQNCSIYYLGGEPGIVEKGLALYSSTRPTHKVVGVHHGFIHQDKALEKHVIEEINRLKPDILFVGMGCPLQEYWIDEHRHELNVSLFYPIGASMDYIAKKIPRCPAWLGDMGLEWLFRLLAEPRRLFHRYVVGNPWFLFRVLTQFHRNQLYRTTQY